MTVRELYKVLCDGADATIEAIECPEMDEVLHQLATWIHISDKGFAKSGPIRMRLECRALIGTLIHTADVLHDLQRDVRDDQ
jgi:hypothetical protein